MMMMMMTLHQSRASFTGMESAHHKYGDHIQLYETFDPPSLGTGNAQYNLHHGVRSMDDQTVVNLNDTKLSC